jgi:ABC-type phosphate/phosphonate transport system permease subunit
MILLLILGTVVVSEWLSARVRHAIIYRGCGGGAP